MKDLPKPKFEGQTIDVPFVESLPSLDSPIKFREDGTVDPGIRFGKITYTANKNLEWE
jgi:hypothetical protein